MLLGRWPPRLGSRCVPEVLVMTSLRAPLAAFFLALPLMAGCNGCGGGDLVCDDSGHCQICDGYGCHDANQGPSTTGSASASGGAGGGQSTVTGTGGTGGNTSCEPSKE